MPKKNGFFKKISFFMIITLIMVSVTSTLFAEAAAVKIKSVADVTIGAVQGEELVLPSTVNALMTNNKYTKVKVKWNPTKVSTEEIGVFKASGTVTGYSKKVKLTVNVGIKAPTDITIERYATGKVEVSWTKNPNAEAYYIYYSINKGKLTKLDHVSPGNFDYVISIPNKAKITCSVVSVKGGFEGPMSEAVSLTMVSNALPHYPNFPANPDFDYDKKDGVTKLSNDAWAIWYDAKRVGEDFVQNYYDKVLKADHFSHIPQLDIRTMNFSGSDNHYGKFTRQNTFYYIRALSETYIITRSKTTGEKASSDFYYVTISK